MYQKRIEVLGTELCIKISKSPQSELMTNKAITEAQRIEQAFSRFLDNNELAQLNNSIGSWKQVSDELFFLLSFGKQLEKETQGTFNLNVKSILESWGYNKYYELHKEFPLDRPGNFVLNKENKSAKLSSPLEIGAIGKGYALDCMKKVLKTEKNIFINAGGDIYAQGQDENNKPWKIFLEHPTKSQVAIGEIQLDGAFLAGSNPSKRKWRNRHHLIDAINTLPANDILSCFVKAETGIKADGYSTALFSMGYKKAKSFIISHKLSAMIISHKGEIFNSPSFQVTLYQ